MTFEEMQQIIQQMLAVQRNLQKGQLSLQERQLNLQERQEADRQQIGQILGIQRDLQEGQIQQLGTIERLLIQSERQRVSEKSGETTEGQANHGNVKKSLRSVS
jgi:hypothetical protein